MADHRCRICTANDRQALVEEMAVALWDGERGGSVDDVAFDRAPPYWQMLFRQYAERALRTVERMR